MSDTTKINMGRRKMPVCERPGCFKRCESKNDQFCQWCLTHGLVSRWVISNTGRATDDR